MKIVADTLQQININRDSLIELKLKLYADSVKLYQNETIPFMKEKLIGVPFWFWQFAIFPLFLFILALLVNNIISKRKARKRLMTLKHHTEIWLRKIIENSRLQCKEYLDYAELLNIFTEGMAMSKRFQVINCKQILSIEKEDLNDLFLSKIIYEKGFEYKGIDEDETENFTTFIENLQGVENNLNMTSGEYDLIEGIVENYNKQFSAKSSEIVSLILEHELLDRPLLHGDDERNYYLSLLKVQQDVMGGATSKHISAKEQIEKIFSPISNISQLFLNKYHNYKPAIMIIYKCSQLQGIYENNQERIAKYGEFFEDYADQLEAKTNYNQVVYERYKRAKVKSWMDF